MPHAKIAAPEENLTPVPPDVTGNAGAASAPAKPQLKAQGSMGVAKMARKLNKHKKSNLIRARCCGPCVTFTMFAMVLVPLFVFCIAAIFALPLWGIECTEQNAAGLVTTSMPPESDPCQFYEWWKYIMGNLVGLATPLTHVAPRTGHAVTEALDLLLAVWSLSLAGVVIGSIAQLTFVALGVEGVDKTVMKRMRQMVDVLALDVNKAAVTGMDLQSFQALIEDSEVPALASMSPERVAAFFREADSDNNGTIDKDEAQSLVRKLRIEAETADSGAGIGAGGVGDPRIDALLETVAKLTKSVDELHKKLDGKSA